MIKFRGEAKIKLAYLALAERLSVAPGGWGAARDPHVEIPRFV